MLPMVAEWDCQEGGRWNILHRPRAVLCSGRIKLKLVSCKYTFVAPWKEKVKQQLPSSPLTTKLVPATLGQNNTLDWPILLCLKAYFCNSRSELGDDPTCSLKLWQKTWVENRQNSLAGRRGHAGSKGSLHCLFFLLLTASWAGRKGHACLLLILILSIQYLSGKSRY